MANQILKTVLTASVAEHLAAFRAINQGSESAIDNARKALREWLGSQEQIGDMEILSVLLEEFAEFAIFAGQEIQRERVQQCFGQRGNA